MACEVLGSFTQIDFTGASLAWSNIGGLGPNTTAAKSMRTTGVGILPNGHSLDLEITNSSYYNPFNVDRNGLAPGGGLAQVNMQAWGSPLSSTQARSSRHHQRWCSRSRHSTAAAAAATAAAAAAAAPTTTSAAAPSPRPLSRRVDVSPPPQFTVTFLDAFTGEPYAVSKAYISVLDFDTNEYFANMGGSTAVECIYTSLTGSVSSLTRSCANYLGSGGPLGNPSPNVAHVAYGRTLPMWVRVRVRVRAGGRVGVGVRVRVRVRVRLR